MMSLLHNWFFYWTSLCLFFNSSSFSMFWLTMEINLISFLFLFFYYDSTFNKYNNMLYYFIIQSLGSLFFLFSSYFKFGNNWLIDFFYILSLNLKLGIFPLYFWFMNMGGSLMPKIFILILSFQKIAIMILFFSSNSYLLEIILLSCFIFGSINIFFCFSFQSLLIISSISSMFWIFIFYINSIFLYLMFFLIYYLLLSFCKSNFLSLISSDMLENFSLFCFLSGLPPLFMFLFKFGSSIFISLNFSMDYCLIFFLFTFIGVFGYINYFQKTFFLMNFLYLNTKIWFKKMSHIGSATIFFIFFII